MKGKGKGIAITGLGLAAAALFGTGCDIFGGGGGDDGGTTPTTVSLAGRTLVSLSHFQYNVNTNAFQVTRREHVVVGTDGSINRLNRNDARDRALTNVLSCPNGNAILSTTGGNNTYYFFDAQKNEIRFLAWTNAGSTVLANDKREPIGIISQGNSGDLIAYCNGQFVASNDNATYMATISWNTIVGYDLSNGIIYSIKYPDDLKGVIEVDKDNLKTQVSVGNGNRLSTNALPFPGGPHPLMAITENWVVFVEEDANQDLVALIFVNVKDGSIKRATIPNNTPISLKGGNNQHASPGIMRAVEEGNDVYIAIAPAGNTTEARIWYGKFDGSQLSAIGTNPIEPDPNNPNETIIDMALDGKGRLYYIPNTANTRISSVQTDGTKVTANAVANTYQNVWGDIIQNDNTEYRILPLPDGVLLAHGANNNPANVTYVTYKAGDQNVTNVQANTTAATAASICHGNNNNRGWIATRDATWLTPGRVSSTNLLQWADYPVVCIDRSKGANELAYIPSVDQTKWQIANVDGTANAGLFFSLAGNPAQLREVYIYGQDVYARSNSFWHKCSLGSQVSCSRLTNVTPYDLAGFSILPVPYMTPAGYISIGDIVQDLVSNFVWSYPALVNPAIISGDGKKLANAYATPDSLCDMVGLANVLVTEEMGKNPIDYVLFNDTDLNPEPGNPVKPFTCMRTVLHTW